MHPVACKPIALSCGRSHSAQKLFFKKNKVKWSGLATPSEGKDHKHTDHSLTER
jgi:hypothetical protein